MPPTTRTELAIVATNEPHRIIPVLVADQTSRLKLPRNKTAAYQATQLDTGEVFTLALGADTTDADAWARTVRPLRLDGLRVVGALSDLPAPVAGAISLVPGDTYLLTRIVDLAGAWIVVPPNTTILGTSSENSGIRSTGLAADQALIVGTGTLPMRNISLSAPLVLDLSAEAPTDALDWTGVNIVDSEIGTIVGYGNVVFNLCAFINSASLIFNGNVGSIVATSTLFSAAVGATMLTLPSGLTITRRIRITSSPFIVPVGSIGIYADASLTIPNEAYILENPNFSGGGTYTVGIPYSDNRAAWGAGVGVPASASVGNAYMEANATATTITTAGTFVKVAGVTIAGAITQRFSHADNRLTYTGASTRSFAVEAIVSLTSGANNSISVAVFKNGAVVAGGVSKTTASGSGRSENISTQAVVSLATNDYIEIWVANGTPSQNITVSDLTMLIRPV